MEAECLEVQVRRDNRVLRRLVQAMARKPGATLVCVALGLVLLLPLAIHLAIMLVLAAMAQVGLLHFRGEHGFSWLISNGQVASVALMFVITAGIMLFWYLGMKNIYTKYFRTHFKDKME